MAADGLRTIAGEGSLQASAHGTSCSGGSQLTTKNDAAEVNFIFLLKGKAPKYVGPKIISTSGLAFGCVL